MASSLNYHEDDFFYKSGLDSNLEYGLNPYNEKHQHHYLEYEDEDFLSVESRSGNYGSMTIQNNWSGEETDKFDVCSQSSDDLLNTSHDLDDLLEL